MKFDRSRPVGGQNGERPCRGLRRGGGCPARTSRDDRTAARTAGADRHARSAARPLARAAQTRPQTATPPIHRAGNQLAGNYENCHRKFGRPRLAEARSDTCSSARWVGRHRRCAAAAPARTVGRRAGRSPDEWWRQPSGTRTSLVRGSASARRFGHEQGPVAIGARCGSRGAYAIR